MNMPINHPLTTMNHHYSPFINDHKERPRRVTPGRAGLVSQDAQHLRDIFYPKGFTDQDIVALSGLVRRWSGSVVLNHWEDGAIWVVDYCQLLSIIGFRIFTYFSWPVKVQELDEGQTYVLFFSGIPWSLQNWMSWEN
jgi:hypothetical protein